MKLRTFSEQYKKYTFSIDCIQLKCVSDKNQHIEAINLFAWDISD